MASLLHAGPQGLILPGNPRPTSRLSFAVPNGLVGYWGFDPDCMDFAAGKAIDLMGVNNLPFVSTAPTYVDGIVGKAIQYGGTDGPVTESSSCTGLPSGSSPLSLVSWFKLNSTTLSADGYTEWFSIGTNVVGQDTKFASYADDTGPRIGFACTTTGGAVNWTKDLFWHQLAVTHSGGNLSTSISIYYDGVLKPLTTIPASAVSNIDGSRVTIGALNNAPAGAGYLGAFNGIIDDCRLYNRAITATEVMTLYQAGIRNLRNDPFGDSVNEMAALFLSGGGFVPHFRKTLSMYGSGVGKRQSQAA